MQEAGVKILFANLGYLRGIDGRLLSHLRNIRRHFFNPVALQQGAQQQVIALIKREEPDICCFVEIDCGSQDCGEYNQLEGFLDDAYRYFDSSNKYGPHSDLCYQPRTKGKSNSFISRRPLQSSKVYFRHGIKKLVYKIELAPDLTLFFAHFSLKASNRRQQFLEMRRMLDETPGEHILLGDFNILTGKKELAVFLQDGAYALMNDVTVPTFTFHHFRIMLDLCICSAALASKVQVRVIPQPFSDHHALLVTLAP